MLGIRVGAVCNAAAFLHAFSFTACRTRHMDTETDPAEAKARAFMEHGIAEARRSYERSLATGEEAFNRWDDLSAQAMQDAREIGRMILVSSDANVRGLFDHAEKLARAASIAEAHELHRDFYEEQSQRLMTQLKDMERLTVRLLKAYASKAAPITKP